MDTDQEIRQAEYKAQKAALTRALKLKDEAARVRAVEHACFRAVAEWDAWGTGWPDDWSRWERAYQDTHGGWKCTVTLDDIARAAT
jgi:hypothetical protein